MSNISEMKPAELPPLPPKEHEATQVGITEKIGRTVLIHESKKPSLEQAHVKSATFRSHLFDSVGTQTLFPLMEEARLGASLEKGLLEFEEGKPFYFLSSRGERLEIHQGENFKFVEVFLQKAAQLLKKSEHDPQMKASFYALLNELQKSKTFLSSNPNWNKQLEQTNRLTDISQAEKAFHKAPSIETLKQLIISVSPNAPQG